MMVFPSVNETRLFRCPRSPQRQSGPQDGTTKAEQQERAHCKVRTQRGGTKTERSTLRRDGGRTTRACSLQSAYTKRWDKDKAIHITP